MRLADLVITATTLTLILSRRDMSGGAAGFLLVFAGDISVLLSDTVSKYGEFERKGVALERTAEYRQLQKEEGQALNPQGPGTSDFGRDDRHIYSQNWPTNGTISVRDLKVRYAPGMPDILHGVSFDVQGGQRIGIVGTSSRISLYIAHCRCDWGWQEHARQSFLLLRREDGWSDRNRRNR